MFLDFACIFCEISNTDRYFHVHKDWLTRIWNSPIGVHTLIKTSLIKWNHDIKSLVMHDQLQNMGRGIVKEVGNERMNWYGGKKKLQILHYKTKCVFLPIRIFVHLQEYNWCIQFWLMKQNFFFITYLN
jgi:hypothetical protein